MSTQKEVLDRRNRISQLLAKSMNKPADISRNLHLDIETVRNDLKWMRKNSKKWLSEYALYGYCFETQQTIEQLRDIELELQKMRQDETEKETKLKIVHELKEVINLRWVVQGEGPTLMNLRMAKAKADSYGR